MHGRHRSRKRALCERVGALKNRIASFIYALSLISLLLSTPVVAANLSPWFGEVLELEASQMTSLEIYDSFATKAPHRHRKTCDAFFELHLSMALPDQLPDDLSIELEGVAAQTEHKKFRMNAIGLTAKKKWFNDIVEDPFSLSTGVTVTQVFKPGLHDISSFYHGGIEGEIDIAVGKEFSCMDFWNMRLWSVLGVGIADIGSSWVRWDGVIEYNWWDMQQAILAVRTLWGQGHDRLNPNCFRGYGSVHHESIDLELGYIYHLESGFAMNINYIYRVFARNAPENASFIGINFSYPIGF